MRPLRSLALVAPLLLSTAALASHPLPLISPTQRYPNGATIPAGDTVTGNALEITAWSDSSTFGGTYYLELEVIPTSQAFTGTVTHFSTMSKSSTGSNQQYPWILINNLPPGSYKWRMRERTGTLSSDIGAWQNFNSGLTAFVLGGVNLTPDPLAFGDVRVGQPSATQTVTLQNSSTGTITVSGAATTGPFALSSPPALPATVAAGSSLAFDLIATPTATGPQTGTLTVTSDAPNSPHTVQLTVTGGLPVLSLSPSSLSFGEVGVNSAGATQTVTLQNTGNAPATLAGVAAAAPFSAGAPTSNTVPAGGSVTFTVTYAPTTQTTHSDTVTVTSDDPSSPHTLPVSGQGVAPVLTLSDTALAFADTVVGAQSAPQSVTLSNTGTGTLHVGAPTLSAGFTTNLGVTNVAQGTNTAFTVTFAPTAPGPVNGTLTIPSDDAGGPHTLTLTGTARAPQMTVAPSSHSFGTVNLGTSQTTVLTVTNPGDAPLTLSGLSFSGPQAQDYALVSPPALPATVAASGGTLQLTVRFTPTGLGARAAQLDITSNKYPAGPVAILFNGTGHGPVIAVTPSSLNFGSVNLGAPSTRTLNVANNGSAPLTVSGLTFGGTAAVDYTTITATPFTVAPGAITPITLRFAPTVAGTRSAQVTVASTDPINPGVTVSLTGVGLTPNISVSPLDIPFGQVRVGQNLSGLVSLQNTGTGPLNIQSLMITGSDASRFSTQGIGVPFTLPAGAPVATFQVLFAPNAVGPAQAILSITSDDPDSSTVQVTLSGSGVAPGVSLSETSLNFGAQVVSRPSSPRTVTLSNTGTASLQVYAMSVTGTGAPSYGILSPAAPFTVLAGQTKEISVVMTPQMVGEANARLSLTTDAVGQPAQVDLIGVGISDVLSVSPTLVDFGTVKAKGTGETFAVTLTNLAADELPLAMPTLQGANPADFAVTFNADAVAAGGSVTANVTYQPQAAGAHLAELVFASTDTRVPTVKVALQGAAVSRILDATPSSFDYGQVEVGQSVSQVFNVSNKTSEPVRLVSLTASSPEFVADGAGLGVVEPGESRPVTIAFRPTTPHIAIGTLAIAIEGQGEGEAELTIPLSGTAVEATEVKQGCAAAGGSFAAWALLALAVPALARRRRE